MTEQFQFDTSGGVLLKQFSEVPADYVFWSDLSPGVQGCIAAMLEEARRSLEEGRRHPLPIGRAPSFSDLRPDTLARIIADWEVRLDQISRAGVREAMSDQYWFDQGKKFWPQRRYGLGSFPPQTPHLNDDGKVCLKDREA